MGIEIEKVTTDSFEMNFFRFGEGKQTLAIIPGLSVQSVMGAAEQVKRVYEPVLKDFTGYVFDRRLDMPQGYTVHDMAVDTAKAIKALGLSDICLFGASQGGMIALEIAIEHPELVKKLAVGSTSSNLKEKQNEVFDEWIRLAGQKDKKELYLSFGRNIYPPAVFEQFKDTLIAAADTVTDNDLERFMICAKGMADFDISDKLERISCPVLVTGAFEDAVLDSDMTMEIAEKLDEKGNLELYMYNGFGHAAFDTAPDYRDRICGFFLKD